MNLLFAVYQGSSSGGKKNIFSYSFVLKRRLLQNGHIAESLRIAILSLCFCVLLLGFQYFMNIFLKKMKPHHLLRDGQGLSANALCKKLVQIVLRILPRRSKLSPLSLASYSVPSPTAGLFYELRVIRSVREVKSAHRNRWCIIFCWNSWCKLTLGFEAAF